MNIEFIATEIGFDKGLGGASNAKGVKPYHYLLFGKQVDEQHPEYSGVYFEFDSQINGSVNQVVKILIADKAVSFELKSGNILSVKCGASDLQWNEFLNGIHDVFTASTIQRI